MDFAVDLSTNFGHGFHSVALQCLKSAVKIHNILQEIGHAVSEWVLLKPNLLTLYCTLLWNFGANFATFHNKYAMSKSILK